MKTYIAILVLLVSVVLGWGQEGFDGKRAFQWLVRQTQLGPRNPGSPGHAACLKMLTEELSRYADQVKTQPFTFYDNQISSTFTMYNIIASFQQDNPSRIMLCAHWDTRPRADRDKPENRQKPILGANDGASGVAVLLELARLLPELNPEVGVDIVLFDGEDYGREGHLEYYCLGSRYFTRNNNQYFPRFAILLDMIGDKELEIPIEGYSRDYAPDVVELVWNTAEELGYTQFSRRFQGYVFDDHVILNQGGIPAIDLIDFAYPDLSNRYWHTLQDTPDKCSPNSLQAVGDVLVEVLKKLTP